ncbi:MAG TPA: aspartyl protease family protein [Chitinophagales bacterium]|nr:aspartyl protease family protein [Chitinophagales bacterium]HRX24325.1 aspartyl protease family protein [Chitinophagales bacterium]
MIRLHITLLFVFLLAGIQMSQAQETVVLAVGQYGDLVFTEDTTTGDVVIPLRRVQNLFVLEGIVDGQRGNFILDTGAPGLVLNAAYFNKGKVLESASSFGVTGGGDQVYRYAADSLIVSGLSFYDLQANVADLGHIENARGIRILGLIGSGMFSRLEMVLDTRASTLGLYRVDRSGNRVFTPDELPAADLEIPLEYSSSLMFIRGVAAGKKLRFVLDTGAENNVLSTSSPSRVIKEIRVTNLTTLKGAGASTLEVASGRLPDLQLGGYDFDSMTFLLTDLSQLETAYGTIMHGMLGYEFLSKGIMVINPRTKILRIYFYEDPIK